MKMKSLHGQHIGVTFTGQDLTDRVLSGTFVGVDFRGATLNGACLIGEFVNCEFRKSEVAQASTVNGRFVDCTAEEE